MNMKNVMVALAAAMLVPALAPTASAADASCSSETNMPALIPEAPAQGYHDEGTIDSGLTRERVLPDVDAATYAVERASAPGVLISVWEEDTNGCGEVVAAGTAADLTFVADPLKTYYVFVENTGNEDDRPFEVSILKTA